MSVVLKDNLNCRQQHKRRNNLIILVGPRLDFRLLYLARRIDRNRKGDDKGWMAARLLMSRLLLLGIHLAVGLDSPPCVRIEATLCEYRPFRFFIFFFRL